MRRRCGKVFGRVVTVGGLEESRIKESRWLIGIGRSFGSVDLDPVSSEFGIYFLSLHIEEDNARLLIGHMAVNAIVRDLGTQFWIHAARFHLMAA